MSIIVTRGPALWEARFDPPENADDGPFVIRIYDEVPDKPYRPLRDPKDGPDAWGCFDEDVLWPEETELLEALRQRIG